MKCSKLRFWHPDCFRQPLQTILVVKHSLQPIEFDDFAIFAYEKCSFFQSYGKCLEFANTSHDFPIEFDDFPFFLPMKNGGCPISGQARPGNPHGWPSPGTLPLLAELTSLLAAANLLTSRKIRGRSFVETPPT